MFRGVFATTVLAFAGTPLLLFTSTALLRRTCYQGGYILAALSGLAALLNAAHVSTYPSIRLSTYSPIHLYLPTYLPVYLTYPSHLSIGSDSGVFTYGYFCHRRHVEKLMLGLIYCSNPIPAQIQPDMGRFAHTAGICWVSVGLDVGPGGVVEHCVSGPVIPVRYVNMALKW